MRVDQRDKRCVMINVDPDTDERDAVRPAGRRAGARRVRRRLRHDRHAGPRRGGRRGRARSGSRVSYGRGTRPSVALSTARVRLIPKWNSAPVSSMPATATSASGERCASRVGAGGNGGGGGGGAAASVALGLGLGFGLAGAALGLRLGCGGRAARAATCRTGPRQVGQDLALVGAVVGFIGHDAHHRTPLGAQVVPKWHLSGDPVHRGTHRIAGASSSTYHHDYVCDTGWGAAATFRSQASFVESNWPGDLRASRRPTRKRMRCQ